jgi:predicted enzyme related to lactoylglutathione lyase
VPVDENSTFPAPSFVIEVKSIDETVKKAKDCGGKLIKDRFTALGDDYAIIEESEGNQYYLWELPNSVPDYCINGVANTGAQ